MNKIINEFNSDGINGCIINFETGPVFRIYDKSTERWKFKDYKIHSFADIFVTINDKAFKFVELDNGNKYITWNI